MSQTATTATKAQDIKRDWHFVDVKGQILGRTATKIALLLMGKSKPYFVKNLDCGDYVVVVNAKEVRVTGKKEEQKNYARHSGYPGGFKSATLKEMRAQKPTEIIVHAVKGMLPDNRLKKKMLTRLFVFAGEEHGYADKLKNQNANLKTAV